MQESEDKTLADKEIIEREIHTCKNVIDAANINYNALKDELKALRTDYDLTTKNQRSSGAHLPAARPTEGYTCPPA